LFNVHRLLTNITDKIKYALYGVKLNAQNVLISHEYTVSSPWFVARRGKARNYVMGHSRRTSGPGAAAARWLL